MPKSMGGMTQAGHMYECCFVCCLRLAHLPFPLPFPRLFPRLFVCCHCIRVPDACLGVLARGGRDCAPKSMGGRTQVGMLLFALLAPRAPAISSTVSSSFFPTVRVLPSHQRAGRAAWCAGSQRARAGAEFAARCLAERCVQGLINLMGYSFFFLSLRYFPNYKINY